MKVTVEREFWCDYKDNAWGGAIITLDDIVWNFTLERCRFVHVIPDT